MAAEDVIKELLPEDDIVPGECYNNACTYAREPVWINDTSPNTEEEYFTLIAKNYMCKTSSVYGSLDTIGLFYNEPPFKDPNNPPTDQDILDALSEDSDHYIESWYVLDNDGYGSVAQHLTASVVEVLTLWDISTSYHCGDQSYATKVWNEQFSLWECKVTVASTLTTHEGFDVQDCPVGEHWSFTENQCVGSDIIKPLDPENDMVPGLCYHGECIYALEPVDYFTGGSPNTVEEYNALIAKDYMCKTGHVYGAIDNTNVIIDNPAFADPSTPPPDEVILDEISGDRPYFESWYVWDDGGQGSIAQHVTRSVFEVLTLWNVSEQHDCDRFSYGMKEWNDTYGIWFCSVNYASTVTTYEGFKTQDCPEGYYWSFEESKCVSGIIEIPEIPKPPPTGIDAFHCCDYVPKDYIPWADGWMMNQLIPPNKRSGRLQQGV